MKYNKIKNLDKEVSLYGFGSWGLSKHGWKGVNQEEAIATLERALELGINFFDTAPIYGFGKSESILGDILKDRRDEVILATKFGLVWDKWGKVSHDISPDSLLREVEESLKRLQTDYIDLYQVHFKDDKTSFREVFKTLESLKNQGVIKGIGVSNFTLNDLKEANSITEISTIQNQLNLLKKEDEFDILPFCEENDISYLPYSPLAQGLLTDTLDKNYKFGKMDVRRFNPYFHDKEIHEKIDQVRVKGEPLIETAMDYLVQKKAIPSILIGSTKIKNLEKNFKLIEKLSRK